MNVWLVTIGEILPTEVKEKKQRTALLAEALRGHNLLWWTSAFNHFNKEWLFKKDTILEISEGYKIFALKGSGYKKNISLSRFIDHRIVAWKFKGLAPKMPKPNIIVASMPPHDLAYEAVMLAKKNNIPILVDIRDPWPDIFLDHVPTRLKNFVKILLYKDFRMIKKTMQMADGLIAATNAFLQWGLRYTQRQRTWKDRVFYLGYKKNKGLNNPEVPEKFSNLIEDLENKFNIFFVGTISRSYHNPFVLLEAAEELSEHDNIHFIIAGDGELFEELKKKTENYSNVTLTGWINQQEIELWLEYSKIGVCPATKNVALPTNKAFAYISAGLPVISAFQGDLKDIIEKYQIGLYYPPNDVDALVSCIKRLYEDKDLYAKMSSNAKRVFDEMFDADKIYEEYADHIEKVINEYRSGEGYGFD